MGIVAASSPAGIHRVEHIMGMPIGIDLRDPGLEPTVLDEAFTWLRFVDTTFSTYLPDSEISLLNRRMLQPYQTHPDVRIVLERCEQLRFETDGYFDIRYAHLPVDLIGANGAGISTGIDPSGLVKGWAVDRAATILLAAGAENFSINAGGDIRVRGRALPDASWRIGIQHPFQRLQVAAVIEANDLAIATSGTYARGNHIVDPHTGLAPEGVLSVTITGPDLGTADAYATAVFAMGTEGPAWIARLVGSGYEAMTILADETVLSTPAFPRASE